MAVYPSGNPGGYPYDPDTDIGAARVAVGDTTSSPYDPVESGQQNYQYVSDAELQQWIDASDGDLNGVRGYFWLMRWGNATGSKTTYKTDDLGLTEDDSASAAQFRELSDYYFGLSGLNEGFEIVRTGRPAHHRPPELSPWEYGTYEWH